VAQGLAYGALSDNLIAFFAVLRAQGFLVGPAETQHALRALEIIDIADKGQVKTALSCVVCASAEQEALFELLFRAYFLPQPSAVPPESQALATPGDSEGDGDEAPQQQQRQQSGSDPLRDGVVGGDILDGSNDDAAAASGVTLHAFFSPFGRNYEGALELVGESDEALLEAARLLLMRVKLGRSRRWRSMPHGSRLHFRRTLRRALTTGGETLYPAYLGHPLRKPRFVLLLDGSRSMSSYSDTLLRFAQALTQRSARVEVFVFSTALKRVTGQLRKRLQAGAPLRVTELGEAWGGGTNIGGALRQFVQQYGTRLLTRDTLVMIASDGLDTGNAQVLGRAMHEIARRSGSVVWLNPLLETEGYQPLAAGMQAALPHIDTFTSASDPASFVRLSRLVRLRR
jgi:uncharacterized protein with von Willebrand factor type A (vWA) domain